MKNDKQPGSENAALELWQLRQRQSLSMDQKVIFTKQRFREYYDYFDGEVYICFSGGLDSHVLAEIGRSMYPDIELVLIPIECPENIKLARTYTNVTFVSPKKSPLKVVNENGYPVVSKKVSKMIRQLQNPSSKNENTRNLYLTGYTKDGRYLPHWKLPKKWQYLIDVDFRISEQCCDIMKKEPLKRFEKKTGKKPIIGTLAGESNQRERGYLISGCNTFETNIMSRPMSIWHNSDVKEYLKVNEIKYSEVYDMGYNSTGCMWCMFGAHLEKEPNRFQLLAKTHPKLCDYYMNKLCIKDKLECLNIEHRPVSNVLNSGIGGN